MLFALLDPLYAELQNPTKPPIREGWTLRQVDGWVGAWTSSYLPMLRWSKLQSMSKMKRTIHQLPSCVECKFHRIRGWWEGVWEWSTPDFQMFSPAFLKHWLSGLSASKKCVIFYSSGMAKEALTFGMDLQCRQQGKELHWFLPGRNHVKAHLLSWNRNQLHLHRFISCLKDPEVRKFSQREYSCTHKELQGPI